MRVRLSLILCGVLVALSVFAQQNTANQLRFRWTDGTGRLHIADALPADASHFGYDLINQYGVVVRHVDGTKTPEQLAAAAAREKAAEQEKKQRRDDQRLLLAYPTEKDLIDNQTDHKQMLENTIASTRNNMKSQLDSLASLLDQAAAYAQRGNKVPPGLQKRVDAQREVVRKQRNWINEKEAALNAFDAQSKAQLQHYRELQNRQPSS